MNALNIPTTNPDRRLPKPPRFELEKILCRDTRALIEALDCIAPGDSKTSQG